MANLAPLDNHHFETLSIHELFTRASLPAFWQYHQGDQVRPADEYYIIRTEAGKPIECIRLKGVPRGSVHRLFECSLDKIACIECKNKSFKDFKGLAKHGWQAHHHRFPIICPCGYYHVRPYRDTDSHKNCPYKKVSVIATPIHTLLFGCGFCRSHCSEDFDVTRHHWEEHKREIVNWSFRLWDSSRQVQGLLQHPSIIQAWRVAVRARYVKSEPQLTDDCFFDQVHFTWANDSINILLRVLEWLYWNDRLPAVARDHAKLACNLLIGPFQPPANLSPVLPVSLALRGEAPNVFPSQTPLYNHLAYEYDHYAATVAFQENLRPYRLAIDAPDPHEQPTAQPSINEDAPYNATSFAESDDLAGLPASYPSQETVWEEGSVSDTHYRENLDSKYNRLHDQSAGPYKRGTTKTSKSYSTDRYSWTRSFGTTSSAPTGGSLHRNIVSVNALSSVASQIPIARQHSIENNAIDSSIDKGKEVMYPTTTPPPEVRAADSMPHLLLPYGANPGVLFGNDQPSFPSLIADDVLEELNEEEMPASHHDNQADAQEEINYFEQAWVDENTEPSVTQFPTEVSLVHPSDPQPWTSDPGTFGFVTFQP